MVLGINYSYRKYGMSLNVLLATLIPLILTGYMFSISYSKAPTFIQPWFLGMVTLAVAGTIVSILKFDGLPGPARIAGIVLAAVASILLIK